MRYVGKYVNIELKDGNVYPRMLVLDEDDRFITIRFQNRPFSIPWNDIKSISISG